MRIYILLFCLISGPLKAEVTVFAAASLRGALEEVNAAAPFPVVTSYAGSATLARQIDQGAPAEVFLSANPSWVKWLQDRQKSPLKSTALLSNKLVLIAPAGTKPIEINALPDLLADGRLVMGHTRAVPAGIYGREALMASGIWQDVSMQILQTDNVRAALRFVALQEARFGVTYATDAIAEPLVDVVYEFPSNTHSPITYVMALIAQTPETDRYWKFLQSEPAQEIFQAHGFLPVPSQ